MFAIGIKEISSGKHLGDGEVVRMNSHGDIVENFGSEPMFQARKTFTLAKGIYTDDMFFSMPKTLKRLKEQVIKNLN